MVYVRDNPTDYDEWVEKGSPRWNYDVPSHFVKSKNKYSELINLIKVHVIKNQKIKV